MSKRDHYKGVPKNVDARIDSQGRLVPLDKKGTSANAPTFFSGGSGGSYVQTCRADGLLVNVYVDSVNGSDDHDGATEGTALKTLLAVQLKYPVQMFNNSRTIVNLINNTDSVVTYTQYSITLGGGDALTKNGYVFRGPAMIPFVPSTGLNTAALDTTPAVAVDQAGSTGAAAKRTRLDFTTAAPGWTVNNLAGYFLRVTRGGVRVFDELPIAENTATTIVVDTLGIVGTVLATDTIEVVRPAVRLLGISYGVLGVCGGSPGTGSGGNVFADEMGATFERIAFGSTRFVDVWGAQFDRCLFDSPGISNLFFGGSVNFKDTSFLSSISYYSSSCSHPAGRSDAAPISTAPKVAFTMRSRLFSIGGTSASNPRGTGTYATSFPVSVYASLTEGIRVQGLGSSFLLDSSGVVLGSGNNGPGLVCRQGGHAVLQGGGAKAQITGTGGDIQLGTGAAISYGTGVGQFEEAAGFNGNFTRALEGTATAPTGDPSFISNKVIS